MRTLLLAALIGAFAVTGLSAYAASFQFTFEIAGEDYSGGGSFEGDLQADGDTILNMTNMRLQYTSGGSTFFNLGNPLCCADAQWSLSGLTADWSTSNRSPGGMGVFNGLVAFGQPSPNLVGYDPDDFRINLATTEVPLPNSLPLAALAVFLLGIVGRRRLVTAR